MSVDLSPENEQFIDSVVAQGAYHDRKQALDEAVQLLREREHLRREIQKGLDGEPIPAEEVYRHLEMRLEEIEKRVR
jgi:putative addiction module CopG family antidote